MEIKNKKILVTGAAGFLGPYVLDELKKAGVKKLLTPLSSQSDLRNREACRRAVEGVDIVIHLAAQVGGIGFISSRPGEIFYNNLVMGLELMEASRRANVEKFINIATVCAYPEITPVPFREENFWDGYPAPATASYGLAKKALVVQAEMYRRQYGFQAVSLIPVNLYGPGDNFDPKSSHVVASLIYKFVTAKRQKKPQVIVWGSGKATREFLYVKDAARAIVLATKKYAGGLPVNLGSGKETPVAELAQKIKILSGYQGKISWDHTKPDGQPRRVLDVSRAKKLFGFRAITPLEKGLEETIRWFEKNQ